MLTHIVLFKLNDVSKAQTIKDLLLDMRGKIAELREIEVGIDFLHSPRSFDLALITRFDNREALDTYQTHPVHVEVVRYMKPLVERSATVDYEE